jgi:hypothetical protein
MRFAAAARGQPIFSIQAVLTDPLTSDQDPQCSAHSDSFPSDGQKPGYSLTMWGPMMDRFFMSPDRIG